MESTARRIAASSDTSLDGQIDSLSLEQALLDFERANARVIELLMVAGIWYLVVVTVLSFMQSRVERFYARGAGRPSGRQ